MQSKLPILLIGFCVLMFGGCASMKTIINNDCCQKTLEIDYGDKNFVDYPNYKLAVNSNDNGHAKLLIPTGDDQLMPCDCRSVVIIEQNVTYTKNVFRPVARALTMGQLEKIAEISLTILSTNSLGFDDFIISLMQHPPSQVPFIRYLGSQVAVFNNVSGNTKTIGTTLYCRHNFALYRLKTAHEQGGLSRFTKK